MKKKMMLLLIYKCKNIYVLYVIYIKYNNEWIGVNVEVEQIEELTQQNDMLFNFTIVASANYNNRRHRL